MNSAIPAAGRSGLLDYLSSRREAVVEFIRDFGLTELVAEPHLRDHLLSYPLRGGKSLERKVGLERR